MYLFASKYLMVDKPACLHAMDTGTRPVPAVFPSNAIPNPILSFLLSFPFPFPFLFFFFIFLFWWFLVLSALFPPLYFPLEGIFMRKISVDKVRNVCFFFFFAFNFLFSWPSLFSTLSCIVFVCRPPLCGSAVVRLCGRVVARCRTRQWSPKIIR